MIALVGEATLTTATMENHNLNTEVIDETLVASISHILLGSNIPCVLWGNYILTIYGVPSIVDVSSSPGGGM